MCEKPLRFDDSFGTPKPVGWWVIFEVFVSAKDADTEDEARRIALQDVVARLHADPEHPGIDIEIDEEDDPFFAERD